MRAQLRVGATCAFVVAACSYDARYKDCTIQCSAETGCPGGLTCGGEALCRSRGATATCAAILGDASADTIVLPAWSQPQWVSAAGGSNEYVDDVTLGADQLEIYFCILEGSGSYKQLWTMSRASITDPWGTPTELGSEFNTPAVGSGAVPSEESPRLAPTNLTLYWSHAGDIWYATRAGEVDAWVVQGALAQVNTGAFGHSLAICDNDYFMISRANGTDFDMYEGQLGAGNGPGTLAAELNVGTDQNSTFLSQDCLTTYFASNASGTSQIYSAQRASPTGTWTTPAEVTAFDTATTDMDPWLSSDQRAFYFASTRFTGVNSSNLAIYMSTR